MLINPGLARTLELAGISVVGNSWITTLSLDTPVKMEDIKKSRQFILCTTVIRYSYVRKIDANQAGWGFNFQSQTKEEYQRWLQLLKSQIPNCEKFARLEILAKVLSWAELDGYEHFDQEWQSRQPLMKQRKR